MVLYYGRLLRYALSARPKVFHILWNNKLQTLDRTVLMLYYKLLRKKVVLTVHNVNAGWRDSNDTRWNTMTLNAQYRLADHLFVHTHSMQRDLESDFSVPASKVTVITYGIDVHAPHTALTPAQAKQRLGIGPRERTMLFFGHIAPYKGLEHLVTAFERLTAQHDGYRLIIAGNPKGSAAYWSDIQRRIGGAARERIVQQIEFIPDDEIEVYFKAADVLVLPYLRIYQSGVLFLGYSFGLPAIVADVGSLSEEVIDGENGYIFRAADSMELARTLERYFSSELFRDLSDRRERIRDTAARRHSWDTVGEITERVYRDLLDRTPR